MRALVTTAPGAVGWQEVPEPALPPHGALVRPLAVARCDLDAPMVLGGLWPAPYTVGHEAVAEVVALGADAAADGAPAVGSRVLVPFQVSCGACGPCRAGRTPACATYRARAGAAYGFGEAGGGHGGAVADLLLVPHAAHALVPAPDGLPPAALAVLPDNAVDGYRAVGPALAVEPGADVLVLGGYAASVGLFAVAAARALGAPVRYVDADPQRLAAAAALGADAVEHQGPWPRRFDRARVVVENTGTADGLACAWRSTDDLGRCTSVAIHFAPVEPPLLEAYTRGLTFVTARADSRGLLPEVVDLVAAGRLDHAGVPASVVPWEDAAEAWLSPALKLVVTR